MTDNKLKTALLANICSLLVLSGCSAEHKVVHELDCVVESVLYTKTGKENFIKREDAIKKGFEYHFKVYDDGILSVNDAETYVRDKDTDRSYSLQKEKVVDNNMKFVFNKKFDKVWFRFIDQDMEYGYDCASVAK